MLVYRAADQPWSGLTFQGLHTMINGTTTEVGPSSRTSSKIRIHSSGARVVAASMSVTVPIAESTDYGGEKGNSKGRPRVKLYSHWSIATFMRL